jgi:hypothetical protein
VKTSRLRGVEIDAGARRARVEAGALWEDVVEPAAEHGFVVLHGSSPDVGVVGYTPWAGSLAATACSRSRQATDVERLSSSARRSPTEREFPPPEAGRAASGRSGDFLLRACGYGIVPGGAMISMP